MIRTSRRLDSFLYEAAQNFKTTVILKNQKPLAVDDFFKAYPNDTTIMQIQSGRTVPLNV
jgi:hypothetical protein